jgi:dTDP-4-dehydrorhamnose reductase
MCILVTGASGQLGSYLVRELAAARGELVAWSGSTAGEIEGAPVRPVDLSDGERVRAAFRQAAPSIVIHAAAIAAIADCHRDPVRARSVNVEGTRLLAELTEAARNRRWRAGGERRWCG